MKKWWTKGTELRHRRSTAYRLLSHTSVDGLIDLLLDVGERIGAQVVDLTPFPGLLTGKLIPIAALNLF